MAALSVVSALTLTSMGGVVSAEEEVAVTETAEETGAENAEESGNGNSFGKEFQDPSTENRMKIRTWWPSADITDEKIAEEVQQIAEAGFGGIELIGISESYDSEQLDAENYGWSTEGWNHAVEVLTEEAEKYGLEVDLTIDPRWPAGVPGMDLNSDASSKKLETTVVHSQIDGTEEETYPLPAAPETEYEGTLVTLVAARTEGTLEAEEETETETEAAEDGRPPFGQQVEAKEYGIYSESLQVISEEDIDLENGTFIFSPSEAGEWTFFAFWSVPTGQTSGATSPTAYVIDHYSTEGTEAMLNYWEDTMLSDSLKEYWQENGGDLFEDSLELTSCDIPWSVSLEEYFKENMGYGIEEYLPLLMSQLTTGTAAEKYTALDNDTLNEEIFSDFFNNLNDMYIENHIKVIEKWCQSLNVDYRAQAQGTSDNGWVDSIEAASYVDVVEGETLGMGKSLDAWRSLAGAANMGGTKTVSVELGAEFGGLYQITWQYLNELINRAAMGGANEFILHGFATDSQTSSYNKWPGWMPFDEPRFSDAWGERQPSWDYMEELTNYVSRLQTGLQYGTANVDLAVYRNDLGIRTDEGYTDGVLYLDDSDMPGDNPLTSNGYTYHYISPDNFDLDTAVVEDGVLNPEYAGYKALVINQEDTMKLEDAQNILEYAKEGLTVIIIGDSPSADGTYSTEDDQAVIDVFEEMKSLDHVFCIGTEDELLQALSDAGIRPSVQYGEEALVAAQHRTGEEADIYYFYNYTGSYDYASNDQYYSDDATVSMDVTLAGSGVPYRMDPWTGEITALTDYTDHGDGTISLNLTGQDGEAVFIAVTADSSFLSGAEDTKARAMGEAISLDTNTWSLDVISYEPGEQALDSEAEDYDPTDIEKAELDTISLDTLTAWDTIEGLEGVSGQGVYTTTFHLDGGSDGAVLDLGDCYDNILEITVNGTAIADINQITHEVDLGGYVAEGENTLTIRIGTTLAAAVRKAGGNVSEEDVNPSYPTTYGLLGGVTVTPYTVQ